MAGMIFPMVAAVLLARSIEWYWVYALAQRGDGKEQHADAPFLFHYRLAVFRQRFVAKHRELTAESHMPKASA
jgi:hypothetical protein